MKENQSKKTAARDAGQQIPNYRIYDRTGSWATEDIYAETLEEAIEAGRDWIEEGDWSSEDGTGRTIKLACVVREIIRHDESEDDGLAGEIDDVATADGQSYDCSGHYSDKEPMCDDGEEHDWQTPHQLVGGIKENPGVYSLGGTAMSFSFCCAKCGKYKREHHAGSQVNPDEASETFTIRDADEASLAWVEAESEAR